MTRRVKPGLVALLGVLAVLSACADDAVEQSSPAPGGFDVVQLGAGTMINEDDGVDVAEAGGMDMYTIVLTEGPPMMDVTINITADGQVMRNPSSLTFTAANWDTPQMVTVTAVNDDVDEASPHAGTITHTSTSGDVAFNGLTIPAVTVDVTDNDTRGVTINEMGGVALNEASGNDMFSVVLDSEPTATVTIMLAVDSQLTRSPSSLTFTTANWDTPQNVTVTAVNDDIDEASPHNGALSFTVSGGDYGSVTVPDLMIPITDNDTAGVTITQSGGTTNVTEGGSNDTYTVRLDTRPTANVTVDITVDSQVTRNPTSLTFTTANWDTAQTVTIAAVNDPDAEGPHTSMITHSASSADTIYQGIAIGSVTANITDNDMAGVTITQSGGTTNVTEGGATDSYTVVLNSRPGNPVTINVTAGTQASTNPTVLTFNGGNWDTAQTVTVTAANDDVAEGNHSQMITHSASSGDSTYNGIAINSVTANITDNDTAGVLITQTGGNTAVTEGGGNDTYTVRLNSQPTANVTVNVNVDSQITRSPGSLTFTTGNWNSPQTVTIDAVDDLTVEGMHTGMVSHNATSTDPNYNGIAINSVTVNITDNDNAGVTITQSGGSTNVVEGGATDSYTLLLNSQPTASVTITVNPGTQVTTMPVMLTFTTANWNSPQTVTVTAVNDVVAEGNHTGMITHSAASADATYNNIAIGSVTANITDNDAAGVLITQSGGTTNVTEGGANDTYTVVLVTQPTASVTVNIAVDGELTRSPSSLTFTTANWNTAQTVTLTAVDDPDVEGSHMGTASHTATSGDGNYQGIAINSVTANITDNDMAGVMITQSGGTTTVTEAGGTDTITAVLTARPTANVTVNVAVDSQVTRNPTSLTFTSANWDTPQMVTIGAVNDDIDEANSHNGALSFTTSSADADFANLDVPALTVTVTDNDTAGVTITQSGGTTNVTEGGATDSYTVRLDTQPTANVTVNIAVDSEITRSPTSLTFTTANWNTAQTVTITAVNDNNIEGSHTGVASHTATSGDSNYNNIAIGSVTANITDNDMAGVMITQSGGTTTVTEAGGTDTITAVLTARPTANVTVNVAVDSQVTRNPTSLTFTSANWNTAQTVTIGAVNDDIDEANSHNGTVSFTTSSADGDFSGLTVPNLTVTVTDNDTRGVTVTQSGGSTVVTEGGATDTFTVRLDSQPTGNVTVTLNPDVQVSVNPAMLTFTTANWNSTQTVTVTAVNDDDDEADTHAGSVGFTLASADANYNNFSVTAVPVTVNDNDTRGIVITPASGETTENGGTAMFMISLSSRPTANVVTVAFMSNDTGEGTVAPASLMFDKRSGRSDSWDAPRPITVTGVDDAVQDGNIAYMVTATASAGDYDGVTRAINLTNRDDDVASVSVSPTTGLITTEAGGQATFTVRLTTQPTASVTVPLSSSNTGEGTVMPSSLTFTTGNWNTNQTVTVRGVDDAIDDNDIGYTIVTGNVTSADPNYTIAGNQVPDVSVTNTDNDVPSIAIANGSVTELDSGTRMLSFTVTMSLPSTSTIMVNYATEAATASEGSDFTAASGTLTFVPMDVSETINVTVRGDDLDESNETFRVRLSTATGGATIASANNPATGTITDDDDTAVAMNQTVTLDEDGTFMGQLVATDGDSPSLTYSRDGAAPSRGNVIVQSNGAFSYTPNPDANGTDTFRFRATDGTNTSNQGVVTVNINPINDAPTVDGNGPYSVNEGSGVQLSATGNDIDAGDTLTYMWDFDNDGQFDDANGRQPTFPAVDGPAAITVRVRVRDSANATSTDTAIVNVSNVPPDLQAGPNRMGQEGDPIPLLVTGSDPGADTLTYTWDFGDTQNDSGVDLSDLTHAFGDEGIYTVTVTVRDDDGATDQVTLTATISNRAPSFATANPPALGQENVEYIYEALVVDPGVTDTITWELLEAPEGMIVHPNRPCSEGRPASRCRVIVWTPTPAQAAGDNPVYRVSLRIEDNDGGSNAQVWSIRLNAVDTDGGGAPDFCETTFGLRINDPADDQLDPDNDGITTADECLAGTDPTESNGPTQPIIIEPVDFAVITGDRVVLTVENGTDPDFDILTYEFQVIERGSNDIVFEIMGVVEGAFQTLAEVPAAALEEDGRYYWRARATDGQAFSPWSEGVDLPMPDAWSASFVYSRNDDAPPAPMPRSPIGVATMRQPTLVVANVLDPESDNPDDVTYEFELLDDAFELLGTQAGVSAGTNGTTGWPVGMTLSENATYRWRARAADARGADTGSGEWSEYVDFQVDSAESVPNAPVILFPRDQQIFVDPAQVAVVVTGDRTDEDGDPLTYTIRISTSADLSGATEIAGLDLDADATAAAYAADFEGLNLVEDTTYYVETVANDTKQDSAPSRVAFRFSRTNSAPGAVLVVEPADGETVDSVVPALVWMNAADPEGDAITYDIEVWRDAAMTQLEWSVEGIEPDGQAQSTITAPSLEVARRYWWRGRAVDEFGMAGPWSDTAGFLVSLGNLAPSAPVLMGPEDKQQFGPDAPVILTWENSVDPEGEEVMYFYEVLNPAGARVLNGEMIAEDPSGVTSVDLGVLAPGGYTWYVSASDGRQFSADSEHRVFTVGEPIPEGPGDPPDPPDPDPARYPAPLGESCECSQAPTAPSAPWALLVAVALGGALIWRRRR